jgi:hypothetical protein
VKADEVLWIGDTWVVLPGIQHTRVRDYARATGAIGTNDDYVISAAAATTMADIAKQYDTRQAGATKVKVLISVGGGWDIIMSGGTEASATSAAQTFERHLAKVATDGTVRQILHYFYPDLPAVPGLARLRPLLAQACARSTVPCNFLDLQPLWIGHPEFTDPSGIQASDSGAQKIADAVWDLMPRNCIAQ